MVARIHAALRSLAALALAAPLAAHAGPPYATDDPEPVPHRHWELYLATQWSRGADGGSDGAAPQIELNYGALPELQLHVIAPFAVARPPGGPAEWGYGDTELGAKLRLVREGDRMPQVGVFPLVLVPTGRASRALGAGHAQVLLPVWLQKSWGPWTAYGGGGWWLARGDGARDHAVLGALVQRTVAPGVTPGIEVFHSGSEREGEPSQTRVAAGLVLDIGDANHLLLSAGRAVGRGDVFQAYAGWMVTLGPREDGPGER